jgi:hypothetical protein
VTLNNKFENMNKKFLLLSIWFVHTTFFVFSQRYSYTREQKGEEFKVFEFNNELSELFYDWIENDKKLISQRRSRVRCTFSKTFEKPLEFGHPTQGVKFKISFSKVKNKHFSKIQDTLLINYSFIKQKNHQTIETANAEVIKTYRIDECYLIKSNYKCAHYIINLNDQLYFLKIVRQSHPFLVKKLYKSSEIPKRYLFVLFKNVFISVGVYQDKEGYDYSYWFEPG